MEGGGGVMFLLWGRRELPMLMAVRSALARSKTTEVGVLKIMVICVCRSWRTFNHFGDGCVIYVV